MKSNKSNKKIFPLSLDDFLPEFQETIKDYICPLCKGVYINPLVDKCGHIYCAHCIENQGHCPISLEPFTSQLNPVEFISRVLNKNKVFCKNKHKECKWIGKLQDLIDHISKECKKQEVNCGNSECKVIVDREDYENHLIECDFKIIRCSDCSIEIQKFKLASHTKECPKFKIDCINKCALKIPREDMKTHLDKDCDYLILNCDYSIVGCNIPLLRKDIKTHNIKYSQKHLLLFKEFTIINNNNLNNRINAESQRINSFTDKINELKEEVFKQKTILSEQCDCIKKIEKSEKYKANQFISSFQSSYEYKSNKSSNLTI